MRIRAILLFTALPVAVCAIVGVQQTRQPDPVHKSEECGIQFSVPAGWKLVVRNGCSVSIVPATPLTDDPTRRIDELYVTEVSVHPQALEAAAGEAGFVRDGGEWFVLSRHGMKDSAQEIQSAQWVGIKGIATIGYFNEQGYAGLEAEYRAVLNNLGSRSASLSLGAQADDVFETVMRTFKFIGREQEK